MSSKIPLVLGLTPEATKKLQPKSSMCFTYLAARGCIIASQEAEKAPFTRVEYANSVIMSLSMRYNNGCIFSAVYLQTTRLIYL